MYTDIFGAFFEVTFYFSFIIITGIIIITFINNVVLFNSNLFSLLVKTSHLCVGSFFCKGRGEIFISSIWLTDMAQLGAYVCG